MVSCCVEQTNNTVDNKTVFAKLSNPVLNSRVLVMASHILQTFLGLSDTPSSYDGAAGKVPIVKTTEDGLDFALAYLTDEQIKISSNDTTRNYLYDKLVAGNDITISVNNEGANETITISSTAQPVGNYFNKTTDDTNDITDTATNRFTNDNDITRLANTSGTNTGDVSVLDSTEIDFTLSGQQITASIKSGSIDETKLDESVNSSLDLADSSIQSETDPIWTSDKNDYYTKTEIDDVLREVIYLPDSIITNVGNYVSGNVDSVKNIDITDAYSVNEVSGVPGFDIETAYSNIVSINRIWLHVLYSGSGSHIVNVDLYNYDTTEWDTFTTFTLSNDFKFLDIPIPDNSNYVSNGNSKLRVYHISNGIPSHNIKIDYMVLVQAGMGSSNEHGSLLGLEDDDHPQYAKVAGQVFTGNISATNLSGSNSGDQDLSGLLPNSHLTDFTHSDIAHTNRSSLDLVSGTNTGDQVLPTRDSLGLDTDDTVTFANLSGTNTGDQTLPINSDFNLASLGDVDDTDKAEGKILKVNSEGNHVYVTDESGTDEKVKYDVSDPTAGYIEDKFVAGTGITLAEGTGANENKLIITNSDLGSSAVTTHEGTYDHSLIATALQSETDPLSLHLDQTTASTFTAGDVTGTGLLSVSSGTLGLDTNTYLQTGGWYDTDQSNVYISGFYNDSGYLTYYDTIGYAENAGYAYYADSANYAYQADYVVYENDPYFQACPYDGNTYGVNNGTWTVVAGDTTFTQWREGTAFTTSGGLVGPCEFNNDSTTYARYWNLSNSSIAEWSDGTNTFTIGGTNGLSYVAGEDDVLATRDGTYVQHIDAGTSETILYENTKDSTDTVIPFGTFGRNSTGTPANGIGGSLDLKLMNADSTKLIAGQFKLKMTDVTASAEYSELSKTILVNGSLVERCEEVLRKTIDATDVSNGYVTFSWSKTTVDKIITLHSNYVDTANGVVYSGDWTTATYNQDMATNYNGSTITAFTQGPALISGDIITTYIYYEL